jgi:hypothetical protein
MEIAVSEDINAFYNPLCKLSMQSDKSTLAFEGAAG